MRTWSRQNDKKDKGPPIFWLRDLLPEKIPNARIMSFQYESKVLFNTSRGGVSDTATQLLNKLQTARENVDPQRPIVFLVHSLGGIIVKQVSEDPHKSTGLTLAGNDHRQRQVQHFIPRHCGCNERNCECYPRNFLWGKLRKTAHRFSSAPLIAAPTWPNHLHHCTSSRQLGGRSCGSSQRSRHTRKACLRYPMSSAMLLTDMRLSHFTSSTYTQC